MMEKINQTILKIMDEQLSIKIEEKDFDYKTSIRDQGIDSIMLMILCVHIENEFNISLDEFFTHDIENVTFRDLAKYIEGILKTGGLQ